MPARDRAPSDGGTGEGNGGAVLPLTEDEFLIGRMEQATTCLRLHPPVAEDVVAVLPMAINAREVTNDEVRKAA